MHDQRIRHLGGVPDLLSDLPFQYRRHEVRRPGLVQTDLLSHPVHARRVGGGDSTAHFHDLQPRA